MKSVIVKNQALDVAIKNYEHKNVQNYFKAHMDDYEIMTGNEIKQV